MQSTILKMIEEAPMPLRSFRAFRTLPPALAFVARRENEGQKVNMRLHQYGSDPRDVRYTVNYVGSAPCDRAPSAKCAAAKVLMRDGQIIWS